MSYKLKLRKEKKAFLHEKQIANISVNKKFVRF